MVVHTWNLFIQDVNSNDIQRWYKTMNSSKLNSTMSSCIKRFETMIMIELVLIELFYIKIPMHPYKSWNHNFGSNVGDLIMA